MTLGEKISILLKENNMTQKELAEKIGTTEMTISRYVRDERQPKAEVIAKIASALNTTTDNLLGLSKNSNEDSFSNIQRLIARNAKNLTMEEKHKLIATLLNNE